MLEYAAYLKIPGVSGKLGPDSDMFLAYPDVYALKPIQGSGFSKSVQTTYQFSFYVADLDENQEIISQLKKMAQKVSNDPQDEEVTYAVFNYHPGTEKPTESDLYGSISFSKGLISSLADHGKGPCPVVGVLYGQIVCQFAYSLQMTSETSGELKEVNAGQQSVTPFTTHGVEVSA